MPDSQTLALRPDVVSTVLPDGAVLLDLETKFFYQLNTTGWAITQLFEAGADLDEVLRRCRSWGATSAEDTAAARQVVAVLVDERLVAPADGEASIPAADGAGPGEWVTPRIDKQPEPLHRVMVSAFDPTLPLAE